MNKTKRMKWNASVITILMIFTMTGCAFASNNEKTSDTKEQSAHSTEYHVQSRLEKSPEPTAFRPTKGESSLGAVNENVVVVSQRVLNKDSIMLKKGTVQPVGEGDFSSWQLLCDEGGNTYEQSSPNPLSYLTTGIASNLLTQLQRGAEVLDLDIDTMKVETKVFFRYDDPMTDKWAGYTDKVISNVLIESRESSEKISELKKLALKSWVVGEGLANKTEIQTELVINGQHWDGRNSRSGRVSDPVSVDNDLTLTSKTAAPKPKTIDAGEDVDMGEITNPFKFAVVAIAEPAGDLERPYLNKIRVRAMQENYVGWDLYTDDSYGYNGLDKAPTSLDYVTAGTAFCLMTQLTVNDIFFNLGINDYRVEQQIDYRRENFMSPEMAGYADKIITKVVVNSQASEEDLYKYFKQSLRCCFAGEAFQNETEIVSDLYLNGNIIE